MRCKTRKRNKQKRNKGGTRKLTKSEITRITNLINKLEPIIEPIIDKINKKNDPDYELLSNMIQTQRDDLKNKLKEEMLVYHKKIR